MDEVYQYLDKHTEIDRQRVMLMPQARDENEQDQIAAWLVSLCREKGLQYCPRKQLEWFGLVRGT